MTKFTCLIDGNNVELEFDAVDEDDARTQYLHAIGKRLVIKTTKEFLNPSTKMRANRPQKK
jgi:hypothetical protein